jgi:anthranilate phosphoribosyltransferase
MTSAFPAILPKLTGRTELSSADMTAAMEEILQGRASDPDIEAFLTALRDKGETPGEIAAAASVMRRHAVSLSKPHPRVLDTCGTGGDAKHTLNVSTLAAFVAAAAGVLVAKHGNRSVSSVCGSADLLEALGVRVDLRASDVEHCLETQGFAFFFAPTFHPATRAAMAARKKIGGKTLFNLLGPLSNPAGARFQLVGVYSAPLVETVAHVLSSLGSERAMVVHGEDGLDELTLSGPTLVAELEGGKVRTYRYTPEEAGLPRADLSRLRCDTKEASVQAAVEVLDGTPGPHRNVVCLNAGAALYVAGAAPSIAAGAKLAAETLTSGAAKRKLAEVADFTQGFMK